MPIGAPPPLIDGADGLAEVELYVCRLSIRDWCGKFDNEARRAGCIVGGAPASKRDAYRRRSAIPPIDSDRLQWLRPAVPDTHRSIANQFGRREIESRRNFVVHLWRNGRICMIRALERGGSGMRGRLNPGDKRGNTNRAQPASSGKSSVEAWPGDSS